MVCKNVKWRILCQIFYALKGPCHESFEHFFGLKIRPGPHLNRHKWLSDRFRFENFKITCQHCMYSSCFMRKHNFSLEKEVFIFTNYCCWVYFFCLILPLKSVRSLQIFSESVRKVIAIDFADMCRRSQQPCWHRVSVIND